MWERFEEIDFSALPDAFVLKCTHNSGGVVVVRNKNELDKEAARTKIEKCLYKNYYYSGREWPYKDIRPRIIAESLVENGDGSKLLEYKIFCFNGKPEIVLREYGDRDKGETRYSDYFRTNGERLPFVWGYPVSDATLEQEPVIEEILDTARVLSKDLPFVRADFYVKDKQPFIGELTFYHWSGFEKLYPEEWDEKIGEMLDLPEL